MKKMMVTGLVSTVVSGGLFFSTQSTEASTWTVNSPESLQLVTGQTSYTMKLGDTLWAISQRVNNTVERNTINLSAGEQYALPVGRVLTFNGDKVTVTDAAVTVVSEATITSEQKVNPNQELGEVVDPTITTPSEQENPATPTNPTTLEEPTEPSIPEEKVYCGDSIPGVNNGAIGTWTNREEMDAYILAHWAENTANGTWTENYVASTNGYGWIAEFY